MFHIVGVHVRELVMHTELFCPLMWEANTLEHFEDALSPGIQMSGNVRQTNVT